ncbi:MAG: ATP phosphoribosyltransferase regulatory subunit [Candidatus Shikimatogenerans bostrichidophilus]|nr:MAG: ATP phosphoribosyltransferase regulatory subunit [Candidatus Shikimatogenerans bostrichidophilus]
MKIFKNIKGTIDFFDLDYDKIKFLIKKIKKFFKIYGFIPLKTPSIENYKIINKIKNPLNNTKKLIYYVNNNQSKNKNNKFLIFDLTIPLLRFLLTNKNNIIFPFKRYQIQKVWRGENTQYNRYREFYQCDVDIISFKYSIIEELELISLCDNIFYELNLKVIFFINHKYILYGLCELFNIPKKKWIFFISNIDKIDKIGKKKVIYKLNKYIDKIIIKKIFNIFNKKLDNINFILYLKKIFKKNNCIYGNKGIDNLIKIFDYLKYLNLKIIKIKFKIYLSRGLNYYNKTIFEVVSLYKKKNKNKCLSLVGGGRYDNIIKINKKKIYCIGLSFGLYRIYNILKTKIYNIKNIKVIFINFGIINIIYKYLNILRNNNLITEIFPYNAKIKKQIKYAIKKKFNFIIILGKKEIKNKIIKIKNLYTKKEKTFSSINNLIGYFKKKNKILKK